MKSKKYLFKFLHFNKISQNFLNNHIRFYNNFFFFQKKTFKYKKINNENLNILNYRFSKYFFKEFSNLKSKMILDNNNQLQLFLISVNHFKILNIMKFGYLEQKILEKKEEEEASNISFLGYELKKKKWIIFYCKIK